MLNALTRAFAGLPCVGLTLALSLLAIPTDANRDDDSREHNRKR